jgi:hypothetical protein
LKLREFWLVTAILALRDLVSACAWVSSGGGNSE